MRSFFSLSRPSPSPTLFPTRRSSDLDRPELAHGASRLLDGEPDVVERDLGGELQAVGAPGAEVARPVVVRAGERGGDRKSTRLNSSHVAISYAVFCLKKKRNERKTHR